MQPRMPRAWRVGHDKLLNGICKASTRGALEGDLEVFYTVFVWYPSGLAPKLPKQQVYAKL